MLYTVRNHSFTNSEVASTIARTTTYEGDRIPNSSGIFLPTFYQSQQNTATQAGVLHSLELVTRATPRNKAENRTNKGGSSYGAVEPLLHPLHSQSVQQAPFTKTYEGISMLYTFQFIRSKIRVTVGASSYEEARAKFADPVIFCYRKKGDIYA